MEQIYNGTPMPKCDFNKVALQHLFLRTPLGGCFYWWFGVTLIVTGVCEKNQFSRGKPNFKRGLKDIFPRGGLNLDGNLKFKCRAETSMDDTMK